MRCRRLSNIQQCMIALRHYNILLIHGCNPDRFLAVSTRAILAHTRDRNRDKSVWTCCNEKRRVYKYMKSAQEHRRRRGYRCIVSSESFLDLPIPAQQHSDACMRRIQFEND